jgi:putative ABC transport system permease protein
MQLLQGELRRQAAIRSVSAIDAAPGAGVSSRGIVMANAEASARQWIISTPAVDHDFFATMEIQLLAGRVFDRSNASDVASAYGIGNVVIDRKLATENGWINPQDAIGKSIYVPSSGNKNAVGMPRTVIGVVENDNLVPLALVGSSATLYSLAPARVSAPMIRISKNDLAGGLNAIDQVWNQLAPNIPLKRKFLSEQFDLIFDRIAGITIIFPALALVAMLVGTMGLVGIATHAMAQRRFEIGIRRTLGASTTRVLVMLLTDFGKPVIIANLIAWPLAFLVALMFSSFFANKASLTVVPFVSTLLLGLSIAWLAVLRQAISAARMNPARVLRHE